MDHMTNPAIAIAEQHIHRITHPECVDRVAGKRMCRSFDPQAFPGDQLRRADQTARPLAQCPGAPHPSCKDNSPRLQNDAWGHVG